MLCRVLLSFLLLSCWLSSASAVGFRLDPSFVQGGVAVLPYTGIGREATATNVEVYPDGKLVVAGNYQTGVIFGGVLTSAFITRLDERGAQDPRFFGGSITRAPTPRVLVQRDGEVLTGSSNLDGPLARYHFDGSLDRAFTDNAAAAIAAVNASFMFVDFALQPDGKVVVLASVAQAPQSPRPALVRLNADGTLDSTFANGRDLFASTPWTNFVISPALTRYADGKLAVATVSQRGQNRGFLPLDHAERGDLYGVAADRALAAAGSRVAAARAPPVTHMATASGPWSRHRYPSKRRQSPSARRYRGWRAFCRRRRPRIRSR